MRRWRVAVVVATLVVAAGCGDSGGDDPDPDPVPQERTGQIDLGAGFTLDAPDGWVLEQAFDVPVDPAEECGSVPASVDAGAAFVSFRLPAAVCAGDEQQVGNGTHGDYVSIDDVADPRQVETGTTAVGPVTTFLQDYTECTNECTDFVDRVALIALDAPAGDDRPTLMVQVDADRMDANAFEDLLAALGRAPGTTTTSVVPTTGPGD